MFGQSLPRLHVARLDLNADIDVGVDLLWRTMRVGLKRNTQMHGLQNPDKFQINANSGRITGFYIGTVPARLRVYDKREQPRKSKRDLSAYPEQWTRIEWEYRARKCPIHLYKDLSELLDFPPFRDLEFMEVRQPAKAAAAYRAARLAELTSQYGLHNAVRLINDDHNFHRYESSVLAQLPDLKRRIEESHAESLRLFFDNQQSKAVFARESEGESGSVTTLPDPLRNVEAIQPEDCI